MTLDIDNGNKSTLKKNNRPKSQREYRDNFRYYHRTSFFEQHGQNDYDLVFIGDSLTAKAEWEDLFPTMKIANRGIGGDTTEGVLNRLNSICSTNASKAFVMIGLNDFQYKKDVFEVFENYKKIVSGIIECGLPVFIQSTIHAGEGMDEINDKIKELNERLIKLADQDPLVSYIDLNKALSPHFFLDPRYSRDKIHLNGAGYAVWKKVITPIVISTKRN